MSYLNLTYDLRLAVSRHTCLPYMRVFDVEKDMDTSCLLVGGTPFLEWQSG